jgi:hypothetical protein
MKAMAKKMEEGLQGSEEQMEEDENVEAVLDNLRFFFIAGICDGTIQGSQKRFSGFQ